MIENKWQTTPINEVQLAQPAKLDLDKKSVPKQKTIQNFTIDA